MKHDLVILHLMTWADTIDARENLKLLKETFSLGGLISHDVIDAIDWAIDEGHDMDFSCIY